MKMKMAGQHFIQLLVSIMALALLSHCGLGTEIGNGFKEEGSEDSSDEKRQNSSAPDLAEEDNMDRSGNQAPGEGGSDGASQDDLAEDSDSDDAVDFSEPLVTGNGEAAFGDRENELPIAIFANCMDELWSETGDFALFENGNEVYLFETGTDNSIAVASPSDANIVARVEYDPDTYDSVMAIDEEGATIALPFSCDVEGAVDNGVGITELSYVLESLVDNRVVMVTWTLDPTTGDVESVEVAGPDGARLFTTD